MNSHTVRPKILITGADLAPEALAILGDFEIHYAGARPSEADLIAFVKQLDPIAIVVRYGRITPAVIDAGKSLKVISKHGSGIDTIDVAHANKRAIQVRAAVGANATAVAEHALSLLLTCSKSVTYLNTRTHAGHWDKSTHKSMELKGKTLGLIGLGAIGRQVAEFAHAFGMKIVGYDPFANRLANYISAVDLETIWKVSDAISLHCPLTAENTDLINRDTIKKMKTGVILINTARGGLINEEALLDGLSSGKIKSAGIDSFKQEPPAQNHPFFGNSQIILTPHIGGVSTEAYVNMGCGAAQNILDALNLQS